MNPDVARSQVRTNSPLRVVYLPVEIQSREFDSKMLIAASVAGRGFPAVIGQQWVLAQNFDRLPRGAVLFKSLNKIHHPAIAYANETGHRTLALEEETLGHTQEEGIAWSCAEGIFDLVKVMLASGSFEAGVFERLGAAGKRIEVTGNSRVDLLKPKYRNFHEREIEVIRQRYGDYILVNTNFGTSNSVWGDIDKLLQISIDAGSVNPNDEESMRLWNESVAWEAANKKAMLSTIRELAGRRPSTHIVVRPHPAEDLKAWNGVFSEFSNVSVVREGPHIPWTLGCSLLIHTSCTTGFEAYVAGKPAISLIAQPGWMSESILSNRVNQVMHSPGEVVAIVEAFLDTGQVPGLQAVDPPEEIVWNCGNRESSGRIADVLLEGVQKSEDLQFPPLRPVALSATIREKFQVSVEVCVETMNRAADALGIEGLQARELQEGLFLIASSEVMKTVSVSPLLQSAEQIVANMEAAFRTRDFNGALKQFRENIVEAEKSSPAWFLAGVAFFELGQVAQALSHFQRAAETAGPDLNSQLLFMLAVTHGKLGQMDHAIKFAEQAHRKAPDDQRIFDVYKSLLAHAGRKPPKK